MSNTKIGITGKIVSGTYKNWFVHVEDDTMNTGGYLVLMCNSEDMSQSTDGFDDWAENLDEIDKIFEREEWKILWLE